MSSDADDIAVARHVKQAGLATPEQLAAALQAQGRALEGGKQVSLLQALVEVGAITAAQRELLEKKLKGEAKGGGVQQLCQFRIKKKLGEGGMGAVYQAEDLNLDRRAHV